MVLSLMSTLINSDQPTSTWRIGNVHQQASDLCTVTDILFTDKIYCSLALGMTWKTLGYVEDIVWTLCLGDLFIGIFVFAYLLLSANRSRVSTDRLIYSILVRHALEMIY